MNESQDFSFAQQYLQSYSQLCGQQNSYLLELCSRVCRRYEERIPGLTDRVSDLEDICDVLLREPGVDSKWKTEMEMHVCGLEQHVELLDI